MRHRLAHLLACGVAALALVAPAAKADTATYTYDQLGRVVSAVFFDGTTTTTITYSYDDAGNRTQVTRSTSNKNPVANPDSISTALNTATTFNPRSNDTDPNGNSLTIVDVGIPLNGTATIVSGGASIAYTPATGFSGKDSFAYTISDGLGGSASAVIQVTVGSANQNPTATGDSRAVAKNSQLTFDPRTNDSDSDGDALIVAAIATAPAHGAAIISNGGASVTYTPAYDYTGSDSFTYTVSDRRGGVATATVTLTVAANQYPTASDDSLSTTAGAAKTIDPRANDTDPDGGVLTIIGVDTPLNGSATIVSNGTRITYRPNTGFTGTEAFSYSISDGQGGAAAALINVTVTAVNYNPVAVTDSVAAVTSTAKTFDPRSNDTDANSDPLTITAVGTPSHGTASIAGGGTQITYTPTTGYTGGDSFTYTISDGNGGTATGTINISVAANQNPTAVNDSVSTNLNTAVTFNPRSNDSDPESSPLTISSVGTPGHGTASIVNGNTQITFTPTTGYSGTDSFTYSISDGMGGTASATVTVTISSNSPPVAVDDNVDANAYYGAGPTYPTVTFNPRTNDSDPNSNPLTITAVTQGSGGTVTFTGTSVTYTYNTIQTPTGLDMQVIDSDSFTYTISDGQGGTATATVYVNVVVW